MSKALRSPLARNDWQTPELVLERVRRVAPIGLDPCTVRSNPTGAEYIRTPSCDPDGLRTNWTEFNGLVYVNPPYIRTWYDKILKELFNQVHIIALIMAKPGAHWFQELIEPCHVVLFWKGRLTFVGAPNSAPFDSAVLYHGPHPDRFRSAFSGCGWMVKP
jgi:hypothetical protein